MKTRTLDEIISYYQEIYQKAPQFIENRWIPAHFDDLSIFDDPTWCKNTICALLYAYHQAHREFNELINAQFAINISDAQAEKLECIANHYRISGGQLLQKFIEDLTGYHSGDEADLANAWYTRNKCNFLACDQTEWNFETFEKEIREQIDHYLNKTAKHYQISLIEDLNDICIDTESVIDALKQVKPLYDYDQSDSSLIEETIKTVVEDIYCEECLYYAETLDDIYMVKTLLEYMEHDFAIADLGKDDYKMQTYREIKAHKDNLEVAL